MNAREAAPIVTPDSLPPAAPPTPGPATAPQSRATPAADSPSPAAAPAPANTEAAAPPPAARGNPTRKRALIGVAGLVVLAAIIYGIYYMLVLNHYESTDNAYVQGNVVQLTPQVGGTVIAINANDTDFVKAGQLIVKLDPADARVALEQAEAQLGQTVREVRTLFVNNGALDAQVASREADLARARSEVARAQDDVNRRAPLVATGAVGQEEFNHAKTQLAVAKSALAAAESAALAAREQLASNRSLTQGVSVEDHPNVLRASAKVREAYLGLARDQLLAPVDGYVARRSVQLGQRVQAGAPLMSIVPLKQVWVEANFKEGQLRNLRIGQPVSLEADVYGKKAAFHGRIEGLGAGTGAAFSLLPAQNATGNWIKVVQRVPVRIALDENEVAKHPLQVGLSMDAKVDISDTSGPMLADTSRPAATTETSIFDRVDERADAEVRKIIAANLGHAPNARPAAGRAPAARAPVAGRADAESSANAGRSSNPAATPVLARAR